MDPLKKLIRDLNNMPSKMKKASQAALDKEIPRLIADFKKRSPVDTGAYRSSWVKSNTRFGSGKVIAGASIVNKDPKAFILDQGATPNTAPWYFPSRNNKSGKLKEFGGKIWAGGLNPGHSLTIGGSIDPVLFKNNARQMKIAKAVANSIIRAI